jgi:hypothetical protein
MGRHRRAGTRSRTAVRRSSNEAPIRSGVHRRPLHHSGPGRPRRPDDLRRQRPQPARRPHPTDHSRHSIFCPGWDPFGTSRDCRFLCHQMPRVTWDLIASSRRLTCSLRRGLRKHTTKPKPNVKQQLGRNPAPSSIRWTRHRQPTGSQQLTAQPATRRTGQQPTTHGHRQATDRRMLGAAGCRPRDPKGASALGTMRFAHRQPLTTQTAYPNRKVAGQWPNRVMWWTRRDSNRGGAEVTAYELKDHGAGL